MIAVEDYRERVLALVAGRRLDAQPVALAQAAGRVLADDLIARVAVPPFDNSAMDGFAVRAADVAQVPVELAVAGESAAVGGDIPAVRPGTAVRVMTGARVPPGADAVVPVELTDQPAGATPLPDRVRIVESVPSGRHIRPAADNLAAGDLVLPAGTMLTPAAIGAAASVGYGELSVCARPKVAVIATGAELVEPGRALAAGEIPDSNSVMVAGLVTAAGAELVTVARCGDEPGALSELLAGLPQVDVIFTTGGVSAGAYEPLRQLGAGLDFCAVAMQPGKPQGCGLVEGVPLVAFPGNPVSSFVSFQMFGRPLLDALTGASASVVRRRAAALDGWPSPRGRRQYVPVVTELDGVRLTHRLGSGSHLVASLHRADALAIVPEEREAVAVGDILEVMAV
ncbi:gephyrin-like molybdotransferase Glp [Micropruina sp.]|uniref:molybdopterin molybdotransferase MoeA n=1 Tax=Micropruina sp. TaxID=2737536 RepID=UPI00261A17E6|nr:gephyrin-like molybdotransferase Glp [Micropruina sp.]